MTEHATSLATPTPAAATANPFADLALDGLRRRTCAKWRDYPADVLPLWVAEMDAPLARPIVEAVCAALEEGDTGYPGTADQGCAAAFAAFAADRWGWRPDPATMVRVTDVVTGIVESIRVLVPEPAALVVTPPVYPPFFMIAETLGLPVLHAPLTADHRLDPAALAAAFAEARAADRRPILLLSNPHNPTGTVHAADELAEAARLARDAGALVISDEIHAPLTMPTVAYTPYLAVADAATAPDLAVTSASKGWNLAGFKAALVVPGAEAAAGVRALASRAGGHAGHVGLIAHAAAFAHGGPWLDAAVAGIDANRRLLADLLPERLPGAGYRMPEATYLAWIDCRPLGLGDDPARFFLERARVALTPGTGFGPGGAGHVRLNLATSPAIVTAALDRMAGALG